MPENTNHIGSPSEENVVVPQEQEAVRTTIVGGRPPGSGKSLGPLPCGIEILLKKASVDPEFRESLMRDPERAAESIELELNPVEAAMLQNMPKDQIAAVIDKTTVPMEHRRAFLGTAAAAMLVLLRYTDTISAEDNVIRPPAPRQSWRMTQELPAVLNRKTFDFPTSKESVYRFLVNKLPLKYDTITDGTEIKLDKNFQAAFRVAVYIEFDVRMPLTTLGRIDTVEKLTSYLIESRKGYENLEYRDTDSLNRRTFDSSVSAMKAVDFLAGELAMKADEVASGVKIKLEKESLIKLRRNIYLVFGIRMPYDVLESLDMTRKLKDFLIESRTGYRYASYSVPPIPPNPPAGSRPDFLLIRGTRPGPRLPKW